MTSERARQLEQNLKAAKASLGTKARLLVVSKTRPVDEIRYLFQLGQRDFGENRVQDLEEKARLLADMPGLRWHLIGRLQSNKIAKLKKIPGLTCIHSVDSLELARKLAQTLTNATGVFLQVNTSREEEKAGFEDFEALKAAAAACSGPLQLRGLMTMGTIRTGDVEAEARRCFRMLREWRDRLDPALELSMGMSGDYPLAIEEGSDWVRVGSKVFA